MEQFVRDNALFVTLVIVWTFAWKGVSLWKAAQRGQKGWFVALLLLNTLGVLDALYIFVVSKKKSSVIG